MQRTDVNFKSSINAKIPYTPYFLIPIYYLTSQPRSTPLTSGTSSNPSTGRSKVSGISIITKPVWESQYLKDNNGNWYSDGLQHPLNDLQEIFSKEDRKAVYQYRTKDAVQSLNGHPEGGAQVNYSGCLIENVNSLANAGVQWGYSNGWESNYVTARGWKTSGGNPRMDIVGFTFHHALSPF